MGLPAGIYFYAMENNLIDHLAIALDNLEDAHKIQRLIDQTKQFCGTYKIGLELFTRYGPTVLDYIRQARKKIFLDLKFHDIPNTVAKAVSSASSLGVHYCTLHAHGGKDMMEAAAAAAGGGREKGVAPPQLIAVTVLTSIDERCLRDDLNIPLSIADQIAHLARLAIETGMDGIVCSAADLPNVKKTIAGARSGFQIVTPGIRRSGSMTHDQKRTATPAEALAFGATLLVIGREVSAAADPASALETILGEMAASH